MLAARVSIVLRRYRWASLLGVFLVCEAGCAEARKASPQAPLSAAFEPALVQPTVAAEDVQDEADTLVTKDDGELVKFIETQVGVQNVSNENRTLLRTPVAAGRTGLSKLWSPGSKRVAFVLRRDDESRALVVSRTDGNILVPTVSWMAVVLNVVVPAPDELRTWYREMARRVATAGRATGIVLFSNGNATAVILGVEPVPGDDADVQLVALTRFMRAGTFAPDSWGPKLGGAANVGTKRMNGHAGVSVRDLLRSGGGAPFGPGAAPGATSI